MAPSPRPLARLAATGLAALALAAASCGGGGSAPPPPVADPCDPAFVGSAAGLQCLRPDAFAGNTLSVTVPALGADEQVALLLVNAGGSGGFNPTVTVAGTGSAPPRLDSEAAALRLQPEASAPRLGAAPPSPEAAGRAAARAGHQALRDAEAEFLATAPPEALTLAAGPAAAPAAPPLEVGISTDAFCHLQFQQDGSQVFARHDATLRHLTASAQYWVTDDVWDAFQTTVAPRGLASFWSTLATAYDTRVRPALVGYYGPESDFDGNGQMIFLFGNLGAAAGGFPVGYFTTRDLRSADTTPGCTGPTTAATARASNGGDFLYLTDPTTFTSKGFGLDQITDVEYPGTMAHELQHNVNWNVRCRLSGRTCTSGSDDDWVNEGLSMLSEDLAGYGLEDANSRGAEFERVGTYLRIYADYSMTTWEGHPDANYGGAHAFMRYWMDQHGGSPGFTGALLSPGRVGAANVANAAGVPFESSLIRFATAAVFSGETVSPLPAFDFDPAANWSPLHQKLFFMRNVQGILTATPAYVRYTPLPVSGSLYPQLRENGWSAFLTGKGTGGPATLTVTTSAPRKPYVVVVRFAGDLPR